MILKKLEITGFKSFAGKTAIDFMPGVTAVVGPNGSGKSNVTEAVRWVLGEQSAKSLRGGKMEDIIFAGSDSRKRMNEAEVIITLDNQNGFFPFDYSEISITRRVSRNGDSHYFINKQSCRLKDIVELFMDSGFGKGSFSIIGQGRVDEILNSRAEDRRAIFEEAAGVLKYKTRKKNAEQKLEETEENLTRIYDILRELESRLEPLEEQAAAAKEYLEKKDELKKVEIALWAHQISVSHNEWEKRKEKQKQAKQQSNQLSQQAEKLERVIQTIEQQLQEINAREENLLGNQLLLTESIEKMEGKRRVMDEREKNASFNEERLLKSLESIRQKQQKMQEQLGAAKQETSQKNKELAELQRQSSKAGLLLKKLGETKEDAIESMKADYIDCLSQEAAAKNEQLEITRQLERLSARFERLNGQNSKYVQERTVLEMEKRQIEQAVLQAEEALNRSTDVYRKTKQKRDEAKAKMEKMRTALFQAYQVLQEATSRRDMLLSMAEAYTGFFSGVKEVLKEKQTRLPGVIGAVAELIDVPKKYETAVETALGGALQHVAVTDEATARKAIAFLKQHNYGRATFLPLSTIQSKTIAPHVLAAVREENGFIGTANELVQTTKAHARLADHLLGNVLIAAALPEANRIAARAGHRYRVVTLEGDVVNAGGSMTGGALKKSSASLLGRKSELEQLDETIKQMDVQIKETEQTVQQLKKAADELDAQVTSAEEQGEKSRQMLQKAKNEQLEWSFNNQSIADRLAVYDAEKKEYEEETTRLVKRKTAVEQKLVDAKNKIEELNRQIRVLEEEKKSAGSEQIRLQQVFNDLQPKIAVLTEQLAAMQQQEARLKSELSELQAEFAQIQAEQASQESDRFSSGTSKTELAEQIKQQKAEKNQVLKAITQAKQQKETQTSKLDEALAKLQENRRQQAVFAAALQEQEGLIARLDVEVDALLLKLNEQYQLTFEEAARSYPLSISLEEAKRQVRLVKKAIEELGHVNISAIEDYSVTLERATFLREQKSDLEKAKTTLRHVMDEMDEEMTRRFSETFAAVKKEFQPAFAKLFGGGRAELKLTDPGDVLNAGVEISAMPPGKKLQHLNLLSGGERALTAIALLFAILRVRPVPFCILDEVEAALDEANVHRFSRYLKEFSETTQFIVITHRKQTMEEADALYGVTMQESGVSSLVSVRLEQASIPI